MITFRSLLDSPVLALSCLAVVAAFSGAATVSAQPSAEAARDQRWANRDTPAGREAFAASFTADLNMGADFQYIGLRGRAALRPIAESIKAGHNLEAMDAFVAYYYAKLMDPVGSGLDASDLSPYVPGTAGYGQFPYVVWKPDASPEAVIKTADALLSGSVEIAGKRIDFVPGKVNWNYPLAYGAQVDLANPDVCPNTELSSGSILTPLAQAYVFTRDERYLKGWVDFMDDWSLNAFPMQSMHPLFMPSAAQGTFAMTGIRMVKIIAELRRVLPSNREPLPPRVLAQVLSRGFGDFPLSTLVYIRSNPHNWTPFPGLMQISMFGDEFVTSPFYFRENKRRNVEDNAVTQNLRDGTENQQDPWYNHNYANMVSVIRLMDARSRQESWKEVSWIKDAWQNDRWLDEIREHQDEHTTYLIHLRTPQGEWPIPFRGGDKRQADTLSRFVSPEAYANSVNQAILNATNGGPGSPPPYTSEWFPYAGYSIMRDGWGPLDGYGAMFCSPRPGAYGGFRSRQNNNVFGLAAAGQDLLVDDTTGHYMYPTSPIQVDKSNQDFQASERIFKVQGVSSHKSYLQRAWTEPSNWRWQASTHFDLVEGIYQGPYIKGAVRVDGVAHQRIATHVRGANLWIITDRLSTPADHSFEQRWMFPLADDGTLPAFEKADFVMDEKAQTISTESTAKLKISSQERPKANLTLYQVGTMPLSYTNKWVPKDKKNHYMVYGRNEVTAAWKADGASQVVTLIQTRPNGEKHLATFIPKRVAAAGVTPGVVGFMVTHPGGQAVYYLSADHGSAALSLQGIEAQAQSLLLTGDRGIILGATSLKIAGKAIDLTAADFEFALKGGQLSEVVPIYRPIDPVVVGPNQTSFADSVDVTLASRTPGVEIHYTLDDSDPTPQSPRYTGPVRIATTTVVKARAYRPGVVTNPVTTDGTQATAVSSGYFKIEDYVPSVANSRATDGVRFSYWQDTWTDLLLYTDQLKPVIADVVPDLFDLSKVPASNPPLGKASAPRAKYYAVQYDGYLNIPQDGVYTFHAPDEYVYPDIDAGYDLRLWVGNKMGDGVYSRRIIGLNEWYPSTRLHAIGSWSIPLKKGLQPFKLVFVDYRTDAATWLNRPGLRDYIWTGSTPNLLVSGPGLDRQPIPKAWLKH